MSSPVAVPSATKEEDITNFPGRRSSPALAETGLRALGRGGLPGQPASNILPSSGNTISSNGALGAVPLLSEMGKRNILGSDDRPGSSDMVQALASPLSNRAVMPQTAKSSDGLGSSDPGSVNDSAVGGSRVFSSPVVPGMQWRPGNSFQNQNEPVRCIVLFPCSWCSDALFSSCILIKLLNKNDNLLSFLSLLNLLSLFIDF